MSELELQQFQKVHTIKAVKYLICILKSNKPITYLSIFILKKLGYDNPLDAPVIVEGGQMAQIYASANTAMKKAGVPLNAGKVADKKKKNKKKDYRILSNYS